jgi:integrase
MMGKSFSLYKRGKLWYVQFKTSDNRFSSGKSTKKTNKHDAESWAIDYLKTGNVITKSKLGFSDFAEDFFALNGAWATDKKVRGMRLSERHCIELTRILNRMVIPEFGNLRLTELDRTAIENFRNKLFLDGYAGHTINQALSVIKAILEAAEAKNLIRGIPKINRAANNSKSKGILTVDEVKRLFNVKWDDYRSYVASLLASSTGLRLGEVLGLVISDYHKSKRMIHCRRGWDQILRKMNNTTKTGRARNIFIPQFVATAIDKLIEMNPYQQNDETFIFFADKSCEYPTEPKIITKSFYKAMKAIGITSGIRKERNITFHSHRHFLNSLLINSNIPLQKIQKITGHLTQEMTQHYYHLDEMTDVQKVQDELFNM